MESDVHGVPADVLRARRILTFLLFAGLVTLKLQLNLGVGTFGPDGSYYAEVARNVRDGLGLVSRISMYHAGIESFPHPTPIYPVWPLLLGWVSRVVPLQLAAIWLPTALYFGTLVLGQRLARQLWPRPLLPGLWEVPDAGHLFVALLGYNALFLEYTSRPYTEGLAFFLLVVLLGRVRRYFAAPSWLGALEIGAWTGLSILVRAQMFLLTLVLAGTYAVAVACWRPRARWAGHAALAALGWILALAPHHAWLSTFHPSPGLGAMLRFEHFHASDALTPVQMLLPMRDVFAYVVDRAEGFLIAYRNTGKYSYVENFGVLHWAPPLAAAAWAPALLRRGALAAVWARLREPSRGTVVYAVLLALGGFASIHTLHKSFGAEWNFATRHALTVLFLFGAAAVAAAARGGAAQVGAIALLAITGWRMNDDVHDLHAELMEEGGLHTYRPDATRFLAGELAARGRLVVATEQATRFAIELPDVGFHWIWTRTSVDDLEALFDRLGADYLAVIATGNYAFRDDPRFDERFVLVHADLSGMAVYRARAPGEALPGDALLGDAGSGEAQPVPALPGVAP